MKFCEFISLLKSGDIKKIELYPGNGNGFSIIDNNGKQIVFNADTLTNMTFFSLLPPGNCVRSGNVLHKIKPLSRIEIDYINKNYKSTRRDCCLYDNDDVKGVKGEIKSVKNWYYRPSYHSIEVKLKNGSVHIIYNSHIGNMDDLLTDCLYWQIFQRYPKFRTVEYCSAEALELCKSWGRSSSVISNK